MGRADEFYKKHGIETPEQKKEREELERKAAEKVAKKKRRAVGKKVDKESMEADKEDGMSGVKQDSEAQIIKDKTAEREAAMNPRDLLDKVIDKYNLPVAKDYVAVDMGFLNKLTKDNEEKVEKEMMEKLQVMVQGMEDRIVSRIEGNEIRLAELRVRELELQVELARLNAAAVAPRVSNPNYVEDKMTEIFGEAGRRFMMQGKIEEVETFAKGKVEEIVDVEAELREELGYSKKRGRKAIKSRGVTEDIPTGVTEMTPKEIQEELRRELALPVIDLGLSTPVTKSRKSSGYSIRWKEVIAAGLFETALVDVVKYAMEFGIDPLNGKEFKELSSITNGAYQQFTVQYKGQKGAWKEFVRNEVLGAEANVLV